MLLRRLTGNLDIKALKNLVDLLEPVKIYTRNEQRKHFSYSPLTRVVDAARPDAGVARNFRKTAADFVKHKNDRNRLSVDLKKWLSLWKNNHKQLKPIIAASPILAEIENMSQNLSSCAAIGLDALNYIQDGIKADAEWLSKSKKIIKQAKRPLAQTELMIVSAIEILVKYVE